jgi:type IV secretory pathway VirB6-like protein
VEGVSDPARQVRLLDAAALAKEIERAIAEIAASRAPGDPAEQRAVEAALEEEATAVFTAIKMMGLAGDALRGGAHDTRIADWRQWVETVRAVFAAADDAWTGIAAELR